MAVLFSKVILTADNGNTAQLLCGGIPASNFDLEDWLIYQKFICDNIDCRAIKAKVDSFLYGEGEVFTANEYEVAAYTGRGEDFLKHPDVHPHGSSEFTIYTPIIRNLLKKVNRQINLTRRKIGHSKAERQIKSICHYEYSEIISYVKSTLLQNTNSSDMLV